jgi:prolyl-tRNA editing enzyme YbaK/EbsC (Cys-tRNA(Pro) deacylase)
MSVDKVRLYLEQFGLADRVAVFGQSSATVELAALAVGCEPARIAKTLSFDVKGLVVLIVTAGDVKIDNAKFKARFGVKTKMLTPQDAVERVGYAVGGVCPFAVKDGVGVYLDKSLQRFEVVYPSGGSGESAVRLTIGELELCSGSLGWVDVTKAYE